MSRPSVVSLLGLVLVASLAACTGEAPVGDAQPTGESSTSATPSPTPTEPPDPNSLAAVFDDGHTGGDLALVGQPRDVGPYTQHDVTYASGDLTITGVMNVPDGDGPHPAVVLAHGYIDPDVYVSGQGMPRELDRLAREGFVVLHTDYRGHAGSDDTNGLDLELRLGYTRDVIAAVDALRQLEDVGELDGGDDLPDVAGVGIVGRSMGGGVTLNAITARPDLVDAAVVYASVSSRFVENFRRWTEPERPEAAAEVVDVLGDPETDAGAWDALSSQSFFGRVEADVMMHHGTQDESCPYAWAEDTRDAMEAAGVDLTFHAYEGERHTFSTGWEQSMRRTVDFLRERLEA